MQHLLPCELGLDGHIVVAVCGRRIRKVYLLPDIAGPQVPKRTLRHRAARLPSVSMQLTDTKKIVEEIAGRR